MVSCGCEVIRHSSGLKRVNASRMATHRSGTLRADAMRNSPFSLANAISIGLKSGL